MRGDIDESSLIILATICSTVTTNIKSPYQNKYHIWNRQKLAKGKLSSYPSSKLILKFAGIRCVTYSSAIALPVAVSHAE